MGTTTEEATELIEEPTAAGWLALVLTVVAALNWGPVGVAGVYLAYVVARSR